MGDTLKILVIDDSEDDTRLLVRWLERAGTALEWRRVDDLEGLRQALRAGGWDIVLSDFAIPKLDFFDGISSIKEADPTLPIIAVSGSIGEEQTSEVLRAGVGDLVLKDRMERLLPAIGRELAAAEAKRTAARHEEALKLTQFAVENASESIIWFDLDGRIVYANRATREMLGYASDEVPALTIRSIDPAIAGEGFEDCVESLRSDGPRAFETSFRRKCGSRVPVEVSLHRLKYGHRTMVACYSRDITDRKCAESALRENEARYRELFDASPVAIWVEDYSKAKVIVDRLRGQGVDDFEAYLNEFPDVLSEIVAGIEIVDANPMAAKLYGAPNVDELLAARRRWHRNNALKPLQESFYAREIAALANGYRRFEIETELENHAEKMVGIRIVTNLPEPYVDTWRRLISTEEDITKRKCAEDALRDNEAFLRLITDNLPILVAYFGRDRRYRFINRTGARWYAQPREAIVGRTVDEVLTPRAFQAFQRHYELAMKGEEQDFDLTVLYPDGVTRDVRAMYVPDRAPDGEVYGFVAMVTDITDRKAVESQLRLITDAVPVLIAHLDVTGRYRFVNRTGEQWYARPRDKVIGEVIPNLLGREAYESVRSELEAATNGETVAFERRITYPDGVTRDVELTYVPRFESDGRVDGIFSLTTDLTERKATQAQLLQAQKMEAVGQLTGGIAHDFNNLLTVIMGNARLVEQRLQNGKAVEAKSLGPIVDAARRGANLTQRLLAFSRSERLEPKVVDTRDLVAGMLDMMGRTLGELIRIETRFAGEALSVLADPNLLEAALLNLATNARDAMPEGGTLTIELEAAGPEEADWRPENGTAAGEYVVFSVSDTGTGIPPEHRDRIFEPFFTTKEVGKGTGLGLSMVFGFVKQSGGHIRVAGGPGGGTTFRLYLPRVDGAASPRSERTDREPTLAGGQGTILVVEDEPGVRAVAVAALEDLGYRVIESENGPAALAELERNRGIDLLFTDIVMPGGMTGLDLAARARERRPGLKVLFTTGHACGGKGAKEGLPKGAAVVAKPYEVAELAMKVSRSMRA